MSERYGSCSSCDGRGEILSRIKTVKVPDLSFVPESKRPHDAGDGPFLVSIYKTVSECGMCGGTGQSGDAMDLREGKGI